MEEMKALGNKFLVIQELLKKENFTAAFKMLGSLYEEYSSIEWVEEDELSPVDNEQQQALRYLYKYSYAQQLINYYCQLFTALIPLLNEVVKYKDDIVAAYSHVDNILEELDALEKAAPGEYSRQSLQSYRSDYKAARSMLSDCCGLPKRAISQDDYEDFLYLYHHQPDLFDDDTDDDMDDNDDEDEFDYLSMEDDNNDYGDYFYEKRLNNIHYYSRGVVKESITKEGVDYRYIIDKLKRDIGLNLEEWQLKDDNECRIVKKLEECVSSKLSELYNPYCSIDINSLCGLLKGNDNSAKPLVIEITATLNYRELGATCIGYVASGEVAVGDTVKLNFNLGNGEHMPDLDDNGVLSANVTWIETNGKELTTKAVAGETLSLGLNVERYLLPEHICSIESYRH